MHSATASLSVVYSKVLEGRVPWARGIGIPKDVYLHSVFCSRRNSVPSYRHVKKGRALSYKAASLENLFQLICRTRNWEVLNRFTPVAEVRGILDLKRILPDKATWDRCFLWCRMQKLTCSTPSTCWNINHCGGFVGCSPVAVTRGKWSAMWNETISEGEEGDEICFRYVMTMFGIVGGFFR